MYGLLLALVSAALFGAATPAGKVLLADFTPFQLAGLLYLGAALGVGPIAALDRRATPALDRTNRLRPAGTTNLLLGAWLAPLTAPAFHVAVALVVGALCYGASIALYITAAHHEGATRTQAVFASAPFIGAGLSWLVLGETLEGPYLLAGSVFVSSVAL